MDRNFRMCRNENDVEKVKDTNLFKISTNRITGPLLPRATLAICWAAFAILSARFKQSKTL